MDQDITSSVFGLSCLVMLISMVVLRRPYAPGNPSLLPWNGILFVALLLAVMSGVHLLGLAGWKT